MRKATISIIALAMMLVAGAAIASPVIAQFSDSDDISAAHIEGVEFASENEVVVGYSDGTFRPATNISRQQAASMFLRYHEAFPPVPGPQGEAGPAGAAGNDGNDGVAGLNYVSEKFASSGAWTVSCPEGQVAISGGYKVDNANSTVNVTDNRPAGPWLEGDLPGGYRVVVSTSPASGGEVFATCADVS